MSHKFRQSSLMLLLPVFILAFASVALGQLTDSENSYLAKKGGIRFVSQTTYPPFEFIRDDGQQDGMMVELARWISTETGFRASFTDRSFLDAQEALLDGDADVITSLFYSDKRAEDFDFTEVIFEVPASIFVGANRFDINDVTQLEGKRIATQKGDYSLEFLSKQGIQFKHLPTENFLEAVLAVARGDADAMIGDEQIVLFHIYENGLSHDLKKVGQPLYVGKNCMAVREGNSELISILNKGIQQARNSGTLDRINKKWLGEPLYRDSSGLLRYAPYFAWGLFFVSLITILVVLWNMRLQQLVHQRTIELEENEERFRAIANYSYNWESWFGNDGKLLWVNPAVFRLTGYTPEESLAMENFPVPLVANENRDHALSVLRKARDGEVLQDDVLPITTKDGDTRWMLVSSQRLYNEGGSSIGFRMSFRDNTERKRDSEALLHQTALLSSLIDSIPDQIFYKSPEGVILGCNAAFANFHGKKKNEIIGRSEREIFGTKPFQSISETEQSLLERREKHHREEWVQCLDGKKIFVDTVQTPFFDSEGRSLGVVFLRRDLTEREHREEERRDLQSKLDKAQKLESLGVLAGGIAHDFNNLLVGILGNVDLAIHDHGDDTPLTELLKDIQLSSREAAALCEELLAYTGKSALKLVPIDWNQLLADTDQLIKISIKGNASIRYELNDPVLPVLGDATQLRQVLLNLAINASEAIEHPHGEVTIGSGRRHFTSKFLKESSLDGNLKEGQYAFVEVTDNGCGMDEETRRRLFDPFFTTKFTGRGLGLASVHGIIHAHGGTIHVASELKKGTTFTIVLPLTESKPGSADGNKIIGTGCQKLLASVLLIDDDPLVLKVGSKMLRKFDATVYMASEGEEALSLYSENQSNIELVILDMTMPDMSGMEILRELKGINPKVKVIICTGYSEQQVSDHFDDGDIMGFIQKPFLMETLIEKVRECVSS